MYQVLTTLREAGLFGYLQLALFFANGFWALVCAVLLGIRWRVPPVVAVAPLVLVPLVVAVGTMFGEAQVNEALAYADPAHKATLLAAGFSEILAQGWFGLLAIPVAFLLAVGGLVAGVRAPRAWGTPALVFAVAGLTALLPAAGVFMHASLPWVLARVLLYGACVVPLALATANAHPKGNGPEGGIVAAAAFVSLVGASELAMNTSAWTAGLGALANVDPSQRGAIMGALVEEVGSAGTLGWVVFALSAVPLLACALRSGPEPSVDEIMNGEATSSPWRSLGRFLALAVWPAWALALLSTDASEALETIQKLGQ